MNIEEQVMQISNRLSFWKGFVSGLATGLGLVGTIVVTVYYIVEIFKSLNG